MKIAVIGSGISGLSAAYLLADQHVVTIFEKDNRLGGHANTVYVETKGRSIPVDTGFMVFNPKRYPNFVALMQELNVEIANTTMSFSVNIPGKVAFHGTGLGGVFADRLNIVRPKYWRFLKDQVRFRRTAKKLLAENPSSEISLKEFIMQQRLGDEIRDWFIYPMLAAIWSIKQVELVEKFPAVSTFRFMDNHNLLDYGRLNWKTIKKGSIQYVQRMQHRLEEQGVDIRLNQSITAVLRKKDHVEIEVGTEVQHFDYVVIATHADTALELLTDATKPEKNALAGFSYTINETFLHGDTSFIPKNKRTLAAWNYFKPDSSESLAEFTYCMNILQNIPDEYPMLVTLNPQKKINPDKIYAQIQYSHPQYSTESVAAQAAIREIQGNNRTLFVGAHLGYGFHEDGIVSAIDAVKHLEVFPSWHQS